jgi:hypothetical protein
MLTTRVLRPSQARNAARLVGADWVLVASKPVGIPLAEGGAAGGSCAAQRRRRSAEWSRQQPQSNFYGTFSERGCAEGNRSATRCQQLVVFESIQTTGCCDLSAVHGQRVEPRVPTGVVPEWTREVSGEIKAA